MLCAPPFGANPLYESIFIKPWPFWVAGLAIGLFVPLLAWITGKALGISSAYAEMCNVGAPAGPERWKLWFALGLPLGGFAANMLARGALITRELPLGEGSPGWTVPWGDYDGVFSSVFAQIALFVVGGLLIGFGARTAGGCPSGHSIVGISIGAKSSLIATIGFMIAGVVTVRLLVLLSGAG